MLPRLGGTEVRDQRFPPLRQLGSGLANLLLQHRAEGCLVKDRVPGERHRFGRPGQFPDELGDQFSKFFDGYALSRGRPGKPSPSFSLDFYQPVQHSHDQRLPGPEDVRSGSERQPSDRIHGSVRQLTQATRAQYGNRRVKDLSLPL